MRPEAVAFDMDDTLLRDDLTISPETISVLRRLAGEGVCIIPASGRTRQSIWPYVEQIGCAGCVICANGAELWSAAGKRLRRVTLPVDTAKEIVAFARENNVYCHSYDESGYFYDRSCDVSAAQRYTSSLPGRQVADLAAEMDEPRTKILFCAEPEKIALLYDEACRRFGGQVQVTCSKPFLLEFNGLTANKGEALRMAAAYCGFRVENTVAFGDSLNDLPMLEAAGIGVAMANARPEVRSRIGQVCGTNNEDGVARWLEAHGREEGEVFD